MLPSSDLHGYRLLIHISAVLGGFMFTKHANRGAMCQSKSASSKNHTSQLDFSVIIRLYDYLRLF